MRRFSFIALGALAGLVAGLVLSDAFAWAEDMSVAGMSPDQWYAYVCGNDGLVFKWAYRGAFTVVGASLLANLRNAVPSYLRWVVPILDKIGLNYIQNAARAGAPQAAKH